MALSLLIVIHEGGHYLFARIFGIKVEKFYLFFDPWFSLAKWKPKKKKEKLDKLGRPRATWRDTEYGIGWLPLGGYVKIGGMIDESMDLEQMKKEPQPWEFRAKPAWQRLLVMIGGVVMNFILAFIIYIGIAWHWGEQQVPMENVFLGFDFTPAAQAAGFENGDIPLLVDGKPIQVTDNNSIVNMLLSKKVTVLRNRRDTVEINVPKEFALDVSEEGGLMTMRVPVVVRDPIKGEPAAEAGLERGDRIISVGGEWAEDYPVFTSLLEKYAGQEIELEYLRGSDTIRVAVTPTSDGKLGFMVMNPFDVYGFKFVHYSLWQAIPRGIKYGIDTLKGYVRSLGMIFTKRGVKQVGGFGAIGSMFPEKWNWFDFWNMTALLSVILGFMNILPIPALDGGHATFALYEIVTRRKPSDKFLERAQICGMIFLVFLLIYANLNDILKLF